MADGGGDCARCCCSFVLTSGLAALFLWLSFRTSKPTFYIQEFYLPALNKTDNSTDARNNHTIRFKLKLKNEMKEKGVGYANISLAFFFNSTLPVANYTVPGFYQGHGKTAHRNAMVEVTGLPWEAAFAEISNGTSTVNFRVKVATRVRSKIMLWFTKSHSFVVAGDVMVDGSGEKLKKKKKKKKDIKLKSGVPEPGTHWVRTGGAVTLIILLF